jgi:hypothetical protein
MHALGQLATIPTAVRLLFGLQLEIANAFGVHCRKQGIARTHLRSDRTWSREKRAQDKRRTANAKGRLSIQLALPLPYQSHRTAHCFLQTSTLHALCENQATP